MPSSPLAADDYASIDRAQTELGSRGWQIRPSPNSVVNGWAGFVQTVERGYDESIYEYSNDMSIRRWAEEARPFLTPPVAEALDAQLAPWDERFTAATVEAKRPPGRGQYWFEKRLPRLLVGEMARDVEALGLMPPIE